MQFERSHAAFEQAKRVIPGGVNSPARAFGAVGGKPLFIARGEGAYLVDIDGNRYIDYIGSWGPLILGHAHPVVVERIAAAARNGTSYGAPTEAETHLAELIIAAVPSVEKVRLVNSGTEATMSALRLARGFTGRPLVAKFAGNYHGHVDSLLVAAGSSAATLGVPNSPGVTTGTAQDTLVLRYNDVPGLEAAFAEHGSQLAAVIVEPVVGNMGCVLPKPDFMAALRRLTEAHGTLLIFDEVMTGFRVAYGGAQSLLGITPDLTTFGKIIGGGLPVGAYGGRAEIMDQILPAGKVFQAGTLSGNPLATAADPPYNLQLDGTLHRPDNSLFFADAAVVDWESAARCNTQRYARFFWQMIHRGVYLPCSQYEAMFFSTAHGEAEIDRTIAAAAEAMTEIVSATQ